MKTSRPISTFPLVLAGLALALAFYPVRGHAQDTQPARSRPAARPTATPGTRPGGTGARSGPHASPTPTPKPSPTPPIIPPSPMDPETNEPSPPSDANDESEVQTEIDATDGATFASKDRIAVFKGNVRVNDPRFQLACDKLTVFLAKSAAPDANAPSPIPPQSAVPAPSVTPAPLAAGNTPPAPGASPSPSPGGGGIDHAVAEGHVIILQKRAPTKPGEEEKVSVGRGEKGTFDNKTGDMVLYGLPSIEQNGNSHSATSIDTVMTIHKDSSLDTVGPSVTKLIQHKGGGSSFELPVPSAPSSGGAKKNKPNAAASPAAPAPTGTRSSGASSH